MLSEGMIIGKRYEIISLVGSGGMADVYNANDTRLNRLVAIKVLKEEYSSDKNFVVKFRGEAQSAAGLSHPNIVNVYDVGEEDGLYYIVMELVEGMTLKKFIERKGKLEVKEAVGIALQIASGMEAAHAKNIIHRDIKPQNIIISKEGKVKVTDFGIAKAATSNTIAAGQAIGSVHYISPEQARGGYSDEKSDIYSLGITLYEMLSGKMPFAAENTVSVALLHIQEEAIPLRELNPNISASLEKIVQKCMQKKPERRYLTVTELIKDLKQSVSDPTGDFVQISAGVIPDSPTINISGDEMAKIKAARFKEESAVVAAEEQRMRNSKIDDDDDMDPKMEKIILFGGIIAIVVLAIVIIFLVIKGFNLFGKNDRGVVLNGPSSSLEEEDKDKKKSSTENTSSIEETKSQVSENVVVPELKGKTLAEAISLLSEAGITSYRFVNEVSKEYPKDTVISATPESGTEMKKSEELVLLISSGDKLLSVPELKNISKDSAITTLQAMKFVVNTETEFSDEIEEGKVIGTKPAFGAELKEGDSVTLLVSKGPEVKKAVVPDTVGKTEAEAIQLLEGAKLKSSVSYADDAAEKGKVIKQGVKAGDEVPESSVVSLVVSNGPKKKVVYTSSVTIDDNPFTEEGESGTIEVRLDQDGKTTTIYSATVSIDDFPIVIDNVKGASESEATCYMYVDGELHTDKYWTISSWNKAEVNE